MLHVLDKSATCRLTSQAVAKPCRCVADRKESFTYGYTCLPDRTAGMKGSLLNTVHDHSPNSEFVLIDDTHRGSVCRH